MRLELAIGLAVLAAGQAGIAKAGQAAEIPARYQGLWDGATPPCTGDTFGQMTLSKSDIRFFEADGEVYAVKPLSAGRIQVEVEVIADGDEKGRSATLTLALSADRKTLAVSGYLDHVIRLTRCPA